MALLPDQQYRPELPDGDPVGGTDVGFRAQCKTIILEYEILLKNPPKKLFIVPRTSKTRTGPAFPIRTSEAKSSGGTIQYALNLLKIQLFILVKRPFFHDRDGLLRRAVATSMKHSAFIE
jgi:hypothetical protein